MPPARFRRHGLRTIRAVVLLAGLVLGTRQFGRPDPERFRRLVLLLLAVLILPNTQTWLPAMAPSVLPMASISVQSFQSSRAAFTSAGASASPSSSPSPHAASTSAAIARNNPIRFIRNPHRLQQA